MRLHIADSKVKLSSDSVQGMAEVMRIFTLEAAWRTLNQANNEGLSSVTIDHLEKVLPQLVSGLVSFMNKNIFVDV